MNEEPESPRPLTLLDLYAIAWQIESDAVERYELLSDQMEVHNNPRLTKVFRQLAHAESKHRAEIASRVGDVDIAAHAARVARWRRGESPESADLTEASYLMTPRDALQMALVAEQRALDFFRDLHTQASDPEMRELAEEFVREETEHVQLCQRLLREHPAEAIKSDLDPAISQE